MHGTGKTAAVANCFPLPAVEKRPDTAPCDTGIHAIWMVGVDGLGHNVV